MISPLGPYSTAVDPVFTRTLFQFHVINVIARHARTFPLLAAIKQPVAFAVNCYLLVLNCEIINGPIIISSESLCERLSTQPIV